MLNTIKQLKGVFNFNLYFSSLENGAKMDLDQNIMNAFDLENIIKDRKEEIIDWLKKNSKNDNFKDHIGIGDFNTNSAVNFNMLAQKILSPEMKKSLYTKKGIRLDLFLDKLNSFAGERKDVLKSSTNERIAMSREISQNSLNENNTFIMNFDVSKINIRDKKTGKLIVNEDVKKLQKILGIKADGKFGSMTENALNLAKRRISNLSNNNSQEVKTESKISLNEVERKETNLEMFLKGKNLSQLKVLKQDLDKNLKFYSNGIIESESYDKLINILKNQGYEFKSLFKKGDEIRIILNKLGEITGIRTPGTTREGLSSKTYFDKGVIYDSIEFIGELNLSERKKLLDAFNKKSSKGLNGKLLEAYNYILEINSKLTENEKIEAVFDFDINGNVSSENNFYIPETEVNKILNNKTLLTGLLKEINYPNFFSDLKLNYFVTRERFIDKIHAKFGKGNDKFIGYMRRESGNTEYTYSYKSSENLVLKLEKSLSGVSSLISEEITSLLNEKNLSGNMDKNTRTKQGALDFMNPNNKVEIRFNGLKELAKGMKDKTLEKYLNSKNFSLEEKDAIVDYLVVYARRSNQSFNGDISKINSNPSYVRRMESKAREKAFNSILGTNLSSERGEIYSTLEKNTGKITKSGKFGLFLDPVSTLNVQGKRVRGVDVLHTKINLLSLNGNPILIPIEGAKKESLFNKFKNILPKGLKIENVKFSLGKDSEGLDDQILVEVIGGGEIKLNKISVDETRIDRDRPDRGEKVSNSERMETRPNETIVSESNKQDASEAPRADKYSAEQSGGKGW